jgi:peroxiredoxin
LAELTGRIVVYVYPMTRRPGVARPEDWDSIPGARGCTPESCGFRDHYAELVAAGATDVLGVSSQTTEDQREAVGRLHLPFDLLSDVDFGWADALGLPNFTVGEQRFTLA